jgi:hypothetical protein
MLLRASGESGAGELDLRAVTEGERFESGIPGGGLLTAFAEAAVRGEPTAIEAARERVRQGLGDAAMVDAAAVIGNFERMVRIADGTGIPLDTPVAMVSADLRAELGIDDFEGAGSTQPLSGLQRLAGRAMSRMMPLVLRFFRGR